MEGVERGKTYGDCKRSFSSATNEIARAVTDRRNNLRIEQENEARRRKEFDSAVEAVNAIDSRESHEAALKTVQARLGGGELPEAWKAKYAALRDSLAAKFKASFENGSGVAVEATLDGSASRKRLAPGEKWTVEFDAWSGAARFSAIPADHPEDYESGAVHCEVPVGRAGGAAQRSIVAGSFAAKPLPEIVVKNTGGVDAAVSVGGSAGTVVKPGETRTFRTEPRTTADVAVSPVGFPEALAPVYGAKTTRRIETGARGTTKTVEASFSPDWTKLDIGGIVASGIGGAARIRPLLADSGVGRSAAGKFLDFARESLADAGVVEGDPSSWISLQDAGFVMDAVLALDCALRLEPESQETVREARAVADGLEKAAESKSKFWLRTESEEEYLERLGSFREALSAAAGSLGAADGSNPAAGKRQVK